MRSGASEKTPATPMSNSALARSRVVHGVGQHRPAGGAVFGDGLRRLLLLADVDGGGADRIGIGGPDRRPLPDQVAARPVRRDLAGLQQALDGEAGDQRLRPIGGPQLLRRGQRHLGGLDLAARAGLDLDVDRQAQLQRQGQHLVQGRHPLAAEFGREFPAGIQHPHRREVGIGDRAAAVGGAVQRVVMDHHRHPVAGQLDVELDHLDAQRGGLAERGQGVLRRMGRGAAMADDRGRVRVMGRSPGDVRALRQAGFRLGRQRSGSLARTEMTGSSSGQSPLQVPSSPSRRQVRDVPRRPP